MGNAGTDGTFPNYVIPIWESSETGNAQGNAGGNAGTTRECGDRECGDRRDIPQLRHPDLGIVRGPARPARDKLQAEGMRGQTGHSPIVISIWELSEGGGWPRL